MKKVKHIITCLLVGVFTIFALVSLVACGETKNDKIQLNGDTKANIDSTIEYLTQNVYNKSSLGSYQKYSVAQASEKLDNFKYYVEVAKLKDIDNVETVKIGNQTFEKNAKTSLSIGNANYIEDKVWYVEDNKLYVSASVMAFELIINNKITVNDETVTISGIETAGELPISNVKFEQGATSTIEAVTNGKEYNVNFKEANKWLGFYYDGSEAGQVALTKKVYKFSDNTTSISYGLTQVETNVENNPVAFYPISSLSVKNNNATLDYQIYVVDKGLAKVKINITVENA